MSIYAAHRAMKAQVLSDKDWLIKRINESKGTFSDKVAIAIRNMPNANVEYATMWVKRNTNAKQ
tara:strand:- start:296 stop:487 length:192 start_codon:yes stop_codon:yes gene_type:complete